MSTTTARAASGHATAAPARVMKSRRLNPYQTLDLSAWISLRAAGGVAGSESGRILKAKHPTVLFVGPP